MPVYRCIGLPVYRYTDYTVKNMLTKQAVTIFQRDVPGETIAIGVLCILYTVGIFGIVLNIHPDFILLTPVNLLVSVAVMLAFHTNWNRSMVLVLALSDLVRISAEMFGVQTGLLFGDYAYGRVLGPKMWGTPLMIGVNWMLLAYSIGVTTNHLLPRWHWFPQGVVAALLMVGLDVLIEPVAIKYGFWTWAEGAPPLQNYIGWFLVSLPLLCIFTYTQQAVRNKVAMALFGLQVLFFLILNIV